MTGIPLFQSTLPVRGATAGRSTSTTTSRFQSTLPVRGATRGDPPSTAAVSGFQSTLPVRGATVSIWCMMIPVTNFNPRSP